MEVQIQQFLINPFGEYWVKVEDEIGCFIIDTLTINQAKPIKIQLISY